LPYGVGVRVIVGVTVGVRVIVLVIVAVGVALMVGVIVGVAVAVGSGVVSLKGFCVDTGQQLIFIIVIKFFLC
jgi:hypothetical protein